MIAGEKWPPINLTVSTGTSTGNRSPLTINAGKIFAVSAFACSAMMSSPTAPADVRRPEHVFDVSRPTSNRGLSWTPPISSVGEFEGSWVHTQSSLADVVTRLHGLSGLTWEQLARLFGVSRRAVHHWASGGAMSDRNVDLLGELVKSISGLPASAGENRRGTLLAPGPDGYSLYDRLRARYATSALDVSGTPFTPEQMLGVLHD